MRYFTLVFLAACQGFQTQHLTMPEATADQDFANATAAAQMINTAFGCSIVTIEKSPTAQPLGESVFAYAYTLDQQNILFNANDTGFFQPSTNSIMLFPALTLTDETQDNNEAQREALHELGHLLGIWQHSPTPGAIMSVDTTYDAPTDDLPAFIQSLRDVAGVSCPSK
jgi:hypothetical protein